VDGRIEGWKDGRSLTHSSNFPIFPAVIVISSLH